MTLFYWSSPPAITWFVVAVVVNAVKCSTLWAFAHIKEEIGERITPAIANLDTTSAPFVPARKVLVMATGSHHEPRIVGRRCLAFFRVAMRGRGAAQHLPFFTAAGFGIAAVKIAGGRQCLAAAIANALPQTFPVTAFIRSRDNSEHAVPFTDHKRLYGTILAGSI